MGCGKSFEKPGKNCKNIHSAKTAEKYLLLEYSAFRRSRANNIAWKTKMADNSTCGCVCYYYNFPCILIHCFQNHKTTE